MTRRTLLLLILVLAAFLRLYHLPSAPPGLYRDEAMDGCDALRVLETGHPQVFLPGDNGREGLYVNVAAPFIAAFGNQTWALRLPAALFGILTVAGIYLLGSELDSPPAGLWAAFFLATSTWHLIFSRIAFRAIAAPLFLVWSLYLLFAALRRRRLPLAILAGCVYGLGFYTYLAYRATPLLIALVLLREGRKSARLTAAFTTAAAVVALPLAAYFLQHPADFDRHIAQLSVFARPHPLAEIVRNLWKTARMIFTRGDINWRHNVAWRAEVFWPVAILFVIGLVLAFRARGRWILPPLWLAIASLPAIFSGEGVPHALRSILMLPPLCLLAALAARRLIRHPAAAALLALALAIEPYYTYFHVYARDPHLPAAFDAPAAEIAAQINALPPNADKYVATGPPELLDAAPIMFLTRSCTPQQHIHYVAASCAAVAAAHPEVASFCLP